MRRDRNSQSKASQVPDSPQHSRANNENKGARVCSESIGWNFVACESASVTGAWLPTLSLLEE